MSLQDQVTKLESLMHLRHQRQVAECDHVWKERQALLAGDPHVPVDPLPKDECGALRDPAVYGPSPSDPHAHGCRCPECDPAYNDPSIDETGRETDTHYYWRRELGKIARRYCWTPDPRRAK